MKDISRQFIVQNPRKNKFNPYSFNQAEKQSLKTDISKKKPYLCMVVVIYAFIPRL